MLPRILVTAHLVISLLGHDLVLAEGELAATPQLLEALAKPPSTARVGNREDRPPGEIDKPYYLADICHSCSEDISQFVLTEKDINGELAELIERDPRFYVRYRALYILAIRTPELAFPIVRRWWTSDATMERFAAWAITLEQYADDPVSDSEDQHRVLRVYATETDHDVRRLIASYLGRIKGTFASEALINTIGEEAFSDTEAIWALGRIGSAEAVPAIINSPAWRSNPTCCALALGRIGTPEAVDYLVGHIQDEGCAEALGIAGDPRALPALRRYLRSIERDPSQAQTYEIAAARIAVVRLSALDVVGELLTVAEDVSEPERTRAQALQALLDYDTSMNVGRILRIYASEDDPAIKRICIWLLQGKPQREVTEAMIRHALSLNKIDSKDAAATADALRRALNRRLHTKYLRLEGLRDFLRSEFRGHHTSSY